LATFLGGFLLQIGKSIAPTALVAYGLVFTVQAGMLALAIALLSQVNVREFQETTKKAILEVIASEVE